MKTKLIGAALGLTTLAATHALAQNTKKIVYASYLSPQHITNPVLTEFFKAIEEDTNGSLTVESHVGGSLLSGRDIPGGVRDGVADAGYFVGAYIPSEMPVDNYLAQFSLWNSEPLVMTAALNELVLFNCPECTEEYAKFNTRYLASYALTPYVYHCRSELTKLEDFKGKRVRGIAAYGDLARALEAVPVNVSPDEAYEALDRGILECALHSVAAQKARSYGEAAKFVILDPLGGYLGASTFNLRIPKWNDLTPDERKAITDNLPAMVTGAIFNYIEEDKKIIEEYTKTGTKFYNADPEFAAFVEDFKKDYRPNIIDKGTEMGIKDPQAISDELDRLAEKWRGLLAENGTDKETYERLLHEEIFSKIDTQSPIGE
ncbi:C4-dicarboxylate TRAP transporter substrate-binding protein [Pseudohoeflea coraliihabitans]|uniref:C4-dicarboxylate TRAP transporter substrate-binding protein n=1 Tax=Pseudohoeflea coraliihabitans TaxID=2860393 RepID=A0ABS6WL64_9HYPH|nr:C4-dicarboxylate TRAP transporter substrate-binding protein [Pseudohoeflea sp. DP4N28-3]MBW3095819.1 C4-dicarboxylate TRAP transporter substrate-binding protein [Pseudohoeflea sp. DP4N28-3]